MVVFRMCSESESGCDVELFELTVVLYGTLIYVMLGKYVLSVKWSLRMCMS
jgi:hypothetical protein